MVGEPPGTLFQVPSCSDWQWAKQELMNNPLLLDWEKPCTDDTIWSLKPTLCRGSSSGTHCRLNGWTCRLAKSRWDQLYPEPGSAKSDRSIAFAACETTHQLGRMFAPYKLKLT